jgi:hypothetical protein
MAKSGLQENALVNGGEGGERANHAQLGYPGAGRQDSTQVRDKAYFQSQAVLSAPGRIAPSARLAVGILT